MTDVIDPHAAPDPTTTRWVPLGSGTGIPQPVVNGQWVKGVGGAAVWSAITPADIVGGRVEVARVTKTAVTNVPISTVTTQTTVITSPAVTTDGVAQYEFRVEAPVVVVGANGQVALTLFEDDTNAHMGAFCHYYNPFTGSGSYVPLNNARRYVPSAGTRTYSVRAYALVTAGAINADTGAGDNWVPLSFTVTKVS